MRKLILIPLFLSVLFGQIKWDWTGGTPDATFPGDAVSNSNYVIEGSSSRNVLRALVLIITGETDETTFSAVITNKWNGEAIATESIDQDTPTDGTRFDTNSGGNVVTTKTMAKTVVNVLSCTIVRNDTGVDYFTDVRALGGGIEITIKKSSDGSSADLTNHAGDFPNGKTVRVRILYITSD